MQRYREEKLKFVATFLAKYNYKNTHGKFLRDTVKIKKEK